MTKQELPPRDDLTATEIFERNGFIVHTRAGSLGEDDLIEALQGMTMVGLRSNTKVTEKVLEHTDLQQIGAFCIGTNQIDLAAAASRGIAAFNAPYEHPERGRAVIGEIIALARRLPEKTQRMHDGVWNKSAQGSHEVRGRTLGIVGYGNIGTQLSNLAESMGPAGDLLRRPPTGSPTATPAASAPSTP